MTTDTLQTKPGMAVVAESQPKQSWRAWLLPHRIALIAIGGGLIVLMALTMRWDWIPDYTDALFVGLWRTIWLLVASVAIGFAFAVPLGLVQVTGPAPLAWLARGFCTLVRGTPLLLQLWLLYFGLGSLFPQIPAIRGSALWPYLREAWPYALLSLSVSFAGYEGEVMRGAFAGVPRGELEAARAFGMGRFTTLRRIWLPRAFYRVLPTLGGEVILQLKSTPLVATITVVDVYGVIARVRQDTFLVYEPLLLLAGIYMCLTGILVVLVRLIERRVPVRGA